MKKKKTNLVISDVLSTLSKYFTIAVVIMVLIICLSGVRFVKSGNVALILRFGHLVGNNYEEQVHGPGLLLAYPYMIDEVIIVPTGSVVEQKVSTHYTNSNITNLKTSGYLITGDQNIVTVNATVKYSIVDPVAYALRVNDIESIINATVSNAMIESAASMSADDILTAKKEEFSNKTIKIAQKKFDDINIGIKIRNLELTKVSMPKEVVDVYNEVNAATVKYSTMIEEAKNYKDTKIPEAQAKAAKLVSDAKSNKASSISTANKDLSEFWGVLDEYKQNPKIVRTRIYNDKMQKIIKKIGKVKVVRDGESNIIIN